MRGGVEFAFTSTTTDADVARHYASRGKVGMVMEVQMGMVDRGAELEWLSQYPCAARNLDACLPLTLPDTALMQG